MPALNTESLTYIYRREIERAYSGDERAARMAMFESLLRDGNTPQFAAMLATNSPPGTKGTDRAFLQGSHNELDNMTPANRRHVLASAKRAGISTAGKRYLSGLGRADNPLAWVSDTRDVLQSCKAQNLTCQGVVNYQATPKEPTPAPALAEDLVQWRMAAECAQDADLAAKVGKDKKAKAALREKIIAKHGNHKKQ